MMSNRFILVCAVLACCLSTVSAAVTGTVLGPDGKPVAGAQVVYESFRGKKITAQTVTDQSGVFTLDLNTANSRAGVYLGGVTAFAPGFALGESPLDIKKDLVVTLATASTVHGVVTDVQGAPVAGVTVRLSTVNGIGQQQWGVSVPEAFAAHFSATTDEKGQWAIAGVRLPARVGVRLDDARFAAITALEEVSSDAKQPFTLTARTGVAISGHLLTPDGKPASGINVALYPTAQQTESTDAKGTTDADGKYHFLGLLPGAYILHVTDPRQRWLSKPGNNVTVTDNVENTAPDFTLSAGAVISGSVLDDATGEKMPAVFINIQDQATSRPAGFITTEEDGRYALLLAPGSYTVSLDAAGYVPAPAVAVTVAAVEKRTVDFRLKQGLTLTGTMVDELGNPAAGANAFLTIITDATNHAVTGPQRVNQLIADKDGHFSLSGLSAGKAEIQQGTNFEGFERWEVSTPQPLDLPTTGPVTVHVRRLITQPLTGRVVTAYGTPVVGTKVTISSEIILNHQYNGVTRELFTDAEGRFSLPDVPALANITVKSVEKPGYTVVTYGTLKSAKGQFTVTDFVMASCSATDSGKVVDGTGKAVAGAIVASLDAGPLARTTSDAAGAFTLQELPDGDAHLIAITAAGCALWQGITGAAALLTLRPMRPVVTGDVHYLAELLAEDDKRPPDQQRFDHAGLVAAIADKDFALASTLARREWPTTLPDSVHAALLVALARTDPEHAAAVGIDQLDRIYDVPAYFSAAIGLGLAFAKSHPTLAEHCYEVAKALEVPGRAYQQFNQHAQLLQLAIALGNGERDAQYAALVADAKKSARNNQYRSEVAYWVARCAPSLIEQVWAGMEPGFERDQLIEQAIPRIADVDTAKARRLLAELQQDYAHENHGMLMNAAPLLAIIRAVGKTDPTAALALARQKYNIDAPQLALAAAAAFQPHADALALYREAAAAQQLTSLRDAALLARIAAGAARLDPQEGRRLLAPALQYLQAGKHPNDGDEYGMQQLRELCHFAYYAGQIEPLETRLLLETAYQEAKQQHNLGTEVLPPAMLVIDATRAWEITDELYAKPANPSLKRFEQSLIMQEIVGADDDLVSELFGED
jgi:5-hydroxyisourate hydrolase-like protein (transthyretin family)